MIKITRANVDRLLDAGVLFTLRPDDRWHLVYRSGRTRHHKSGDVDVPIYVHGGVGVINQRDFNADGLLDPEHFRHKNDLPPGVRRVE